MGGPDMDTVARIAGVGGILGAVLWLAVAWQSGRLPVAEVPGETGGPDAIQPKPPARVVLGSNSCNGAGCHGAKIHEEGDRQRKELWRSSATIWTSQDRHADAYRTLLTGTSREMIRKLGEEVPAHENPRCLACHSDPTLAASRPSPEVVRLRSEGVHCEACHGPAGDWVDDHKTWPPRADRRQEYARVGMTWLNDLTARAAACAGCHVGAPADPKAGISVARDVNHDLIAAGHPRLHFEFATYQRALPPHWREKDRRSWKPIPEGFETRAWQAGQMASVQAALALLLDRLPPEGKEERAPGRPWPEFSEANCFDCHHDLKAGGRAVPSAGRKRGVTGWHAGGELEGLSRGWDRGKGLPGEVGALLNAMKARVPRADRLRSVIPGIQTGLVGQSLSPAELLRRIRPTKEELGRMNWDEAGWLHHVLVAIELARREAGGGVAGELDIRFTVLTEGLRLPREVGADKGRVRSPSHYDAERIRPSFEEVMEQMGRLLRPGP